MGGKNKKSDLEGYSKTELMAMTVSEIVAELITAHRKNKDVNLNKLKCSISSKHGLSNQPKLVDIIAAVPPDYKVMIVVNFSSKDYRFAEYSKV